LNSPKFLAVSC